jgi:hypothetical protein
LKIRLRRSSRTRGMLRLTTGGRTTASGFQLRPTQLESAQAPLAVGLVPASITRDMSVCTDSISPWQTHRCPGQWHRRTYPPHNPGQPQPGPPSESSDLLPLKYGDRTLRRHRRCDHRRRRSGRVLVPCHSPPPPPTNSGSRRRSCGRCNSRYPQAFSLPSDQTTAGRRSAGAHRHGRGGERLGPPK